MSLDFSWNLEKQLVVRRNDGVLQILGIFLLSAAAFVFGAADRTSLVLGQEAGQEARFSTSILDEDPFDLITLSEEWGRQQFKTLLIELPNRRLPSDRSGNAEIEVRLQLYPDRKYVVSWKDIEKVELFEQLVLNETNRLIAEKQFAPAFEHINYLRTNFPNTPGLETMRQNLLLSSALDMIRSRQFAHALAVLEEFLRAYPNDRRAEQARSKISELASDLIEDYFERGDLVTATKMIERLERDYRETPIAAVQEWKNRFLEYAKEFLAKAIAFREEGNYPDAREAATRMLEIAPDIEGGKKLLQELIEAYPMVRVGVFQKATRFDSSNIADWPTRRAGALVSQPLIEFRNTGPEGGTYRFSLGNFQHSDDRTEIELRFTDARKEGYPDAYEVSQWMLRRADINGPEYFAPWSAIMRDVSVSGPESLTVKLKRPHVLPHAFLQWPLELLFANSEEMTGLYQQGEDRSGSRLSMRWAAKAEPQPLQPLEIIETTYNDPKRAIADLMKGDIEIIDRLFPADAVLLRGVPNIRVESYALPMVHMLVPISDHPYLADRDFRRTLLYAINRQAILEGEILGGVATEDSRLISGPFPIGQGENDPLSYAYNRAIPPVPYDPRLAKLLVLLTQQKFNTMAIKLKEEPPELTPIRLGVPDYESARVAGQAIIQQWALIDIPGELVPLESISRQDAEGKVDLLYVSAALWEPATDAERLLGEGGLAASDNIFIVQVLGNLRTARNWREIRQFAQDLHRLVNDHLPVLPLWQVGESFAYRTMLQGVPRKPVTLYQDIQRWRMSLNSQP